MILMKISIMTITPPFDMKTLRKPLGSLASAVLFLAITLFCASPLYAKKGNEQGKNHAEMIRELQEFKIKFLIQEAEISKDQQAEFIRIYTEMNSAKHNLFKACHDEQKALKAKNSPTDEDYLRVSEKIAETKSAEGALELKYFRELKKLLSPKQLYKLKEAELKFNRKMMKMKDKNSKDK